MASCTHRHDCQEKECAATWNLFKSIDINGVVALNEAVDGGAKSVLKNWELRLDTTTVLESNDDDPELIVYIPFTTDVKVKSISVIGGTDGTSPARMHAYLNREDIDFSNAREFVPIQEWDLVENYRGELEYQTKYSRFQHVSSLILHFPQNFGGNTTVIHYIGLKGEATKEKRALVTNAIHETVLNPSEHNMVNGGAPGGVPEVS